MSNLNPGGGGGGTTAPPATSTVPGIIQLAGDLGGTSSAPTVVGVERTVNKNAANGYIGADGAGKVPTSSLPAAIVGALQYQGVYDASSGTAPPGAAKGFFWIISLAGTISSTAYKAGDWIVWDGTQFDKIDNGQNVSSVAGRMGAILLTEADIANLTADLTTLTSGVATNAAAVLLRVVAMSSAATITTAAAPLPGVKNIYSASGGSLAPPLPALSTFTGAGPWPAEYLIEKSILDTSANTITATCAGSDTFADGATSKVLGVASEWAILIVVLYGGTKYWAVKGQGLSRAQADLRWALQTSVQLAVAGTSRIRFLDYGSGWPATRPVLAADELLVTRFGTAQPSWLLAGDEWKLVS